MHFILQKSVVDQIKADIKTPTGKSSIPLETKYFYIIHHLNHVKIFKKEVYSEGIPLSSHLLTKLFSTSSEVNKVISYLINSKLIIKTREHITNVGCSKYKLHSSIESERIYHVTLDERDSALIRKILDHHGDIKFYHKQLSIIQKSISLNNSGLSYLTNKYGSLPQEITDIDIEPLDLALIQIYYKKFYALRPDLNSRVYSNLTSLPRIHRKFILFNGKMMLLTDISNSQILLTVPLLHKYWAKKSGRGLFNLPTDIIQFQKLSETGMFYECLAESVGFKALDDKQRSDFKKKVFQEIWFSKVSNRKSKIKNAFKEEFPNVFLIIAELKKPKINETNKANILKPHRDFAISLQRFEANIIIDKVWKALIKTGRQVLTLHDAIICTSNDDLCFAEELISIELMKFRLTPKFKREFS